MLVRSGSGAVPLVANDRVKDVRDEYFLDTVLNSSCHIEARVTN